MGRRKSSEHQDEKYTKVTIWLWEDQLEQIERSRRELNMSRSAYIRQMLEKGTVTQKSLTQEEMEVFKETGKAINDNLMVNVEIMLQQKRNGVLTPHQEQILDENAANLTAFRRKMEQAKED